MIFRVEKTKDYTIMSNYHLREKKMSLKAKGLLSWMLSNDDGWDYSIKGIVANCKENETAIKSTLQELQEFGYLEIRKCLPNKDISVIHYEYIVHEQAIGNQVLENLDVENQELEDQGQRNTIASNTNKRNTKEEKDNSQNQSFLGSANSLRESHKQKDIDRFVQLYNEHCPSLPKIRDITDKRKQAIQYIVKKYSWEDIIQVFDNTEASDFLKGNNDRGWKASFDFILRKDKFVNILEGMYGSKKTGKGKDGLVIAPRASKEDLDGYIYEF